MPPSRILVVEDEAVTAMDIEQRLTNLGYHVVGRSASGEHALALTERHRPDLALMDIRLRGSMDGIDAAQQIRQRFRLPVVFLTAHSEDATLEEAKRAEPFGFILKPFQNQELRSAIEIALYRHRSELEIQRLNRLYATISQVNQAVVRCRSRETLGEDVCRVLVEIGSFQAAWIGWKKAAAEPLQTFGHCTSGPSTGPQPLASPSTCSLVDDVLRTGRPCLCNDPQTDALPAGCREWPDRLEASSCAAFPLELHGQVCGAFRVCVGEPDFFSGQELSLLEEVAADISFALDKLDEEDQRRRAEAELRRLMTAIQQAGECIVVTDLQGTIEYVNPAFEVVTGYTRQEAVGQNPRILKSGRQDDAFYRQLWETITGGRTWQGRMVNRRKDGTLYTEDATISPIRDAAGHVVSFVAIKRDVTEHIRAGEEKAHLEDQLRQAQKTEAIGRLAGGIAHDFNNMLSVMLGYGEIVLSQLHPADSLWDNVNQIVKAAQRSAQLTRQLLAFSRRQTLRPEVLDLNAVVQGVETMLHRVIGEDVQVILKLAPALACVRADPGQLEQVLMNLAVNSRDAMPEGGRLIIETANAQLDAEDAARHAGLAPGKYVLLTVTDTGCGMDQQTLSHLFEPFFTTKEQGKGTGLGLATVFGIVKQSGGDIQVCSEPGHGTTFQIYLPPTAAGAGRQEMPAGKEVLRGAGERILLVEDEASLRDMYETTLARLGYQVLAAANGDEALRAVREAGWKPDLVVTDMVMPEMGGSVLIERLRQSQPDLKALYLSGYAHAATPEHAIPSSGASFLQKPFTVHQLSARVREILTPRAPQRSSRSVLMIDDDASFLGLVRHTCLQQGWEFAGADSASAALEVLAKTPVDVLLVDMNVSGADGTHLLGAIRTAGYHQPAIVLTGDLFSWDREGAAALRVVDVLEKTADCRQLLERIERLGLGETS